MGLLEGGAGNSLGARERKRWVRRSYLRSLDVCTIGPTLRFRACPGCSRPLPISPNASSRRREPEGRGRALTFLIKFCCTRARLGAKKAVDLVKAGLNLRLADEKQKLLMKDYEAENHDARMDERARQLGRRGRRRGRRARGGRRGRARPVRAAECVRIALSP